MFKNLRQEPPINKIQPAHIGACLFYLIAYANIMNVNSLTAVHDKNIVYLTIKQLPTQTNSLLIFSDCYQQQKQGHSTLPNKVCNHSSVSSIIPEGTLINQGPLESRTLARGAAITLHLNIYQKLIEILNYVYVSCR